MKNTMGDLLSLQGKNAIVTGGAKGIGLGISTAFAQQGANVAIFARDKAVGDEVIQNLGHQYSGRFSFYTADISDLKSCQEAVDQYIQDYGSVDILVNNAGIPAGSTFLSMDAEMSEWFKCMNVDLHGGARMCYLVCKHMIDAGKGGRIINITSNAGEIVNEPIMTAYATAKAAFNHFTRCLAAEAVQHNIRVNAIAPGFTISGFIDDTESDLFKEICSTIPIKRFAEPIEIGALAAYLASDAANIITGAVFTADGGYSLQH